MKRLIVNADDFGLSPGVNRGILEAVKSGAVTSVSSLTYGAVPLTELAGKCGVHLRLTDGPPCQDHARVRSLLRPDGRFPRYRDGIGKPNPDEIRLEWLEQMDIMLGHATHFDTHSHSHELAEVFPVYAEMCRDAGVVGVPLNDRQACILRQMRVRCPDYCERRWRGRGNLGELLREDFAQYETVHLMTHPGYVDDVLRQRSTMCADRERELAFLLSADFRAMLDREGITLAGMADVPMPADPLAKVDIVYLAHNRLRFTQESLKALAANTDWSRVRRFILYDDQSEDGASEYLTNAAMFLDHLNLSVRKGVFGGPVAVMNRYLSGATRAPFFAKIDNDTMVPPGWLNACLDVLAAHPFVDLLGIEAKYPVDSYHQHDDGKRTAEPCSHVGGIGLFRSSAFAQLPEAKGRIGFGDWQNQHPEVTRAWLNPALPVFLLDRLPMAPWAGLSAAYEAKGWQRPWTRYTEADAALWGWWDGK